MRALLRFLLLMLPLSGCVSGEGDLSSMLATGEGGSYKIGTPYEIEGATYVPHENPLYREEGIASWYGKKFHGRKTANGELFDMSKLTAAHRTLPLPVYVRVTNLENNKRILLRVNDRGPFSRARIIDVSKKAAELLGFAHKGTARVRVEYAGKASIPPK